MIAKGNADASEMKFRAGAVVFIETTVSGCNMKWTLLPGSGRQQALEYRHYEEFYQRSRTLAHHITATR
ncbi:hypothetical protein G5B41_13265 [bacterium SGD-2]|nr:hypothetical protein [bacterium SGD-2]